MITRKEALKIIYFKLKDKKVKWAIIGSTNTALQGMNIAPNDLDIITNPDDLKIFKEVLKEYVVKPICKKPPYKKGYPEFYELKLNIEGIKVHIIGEYDNDIYYSRVSEGNIILINLDNLKIPCFTLEAEAQAYEETNRGNKAEMIKDFLSNK